MGNCPTKYFTSVISKYSKSRKKSVICLKFHSESTWKVYPFSKSPIRLKIGRSGTEIWLIILTEKKLCRAVLKYVEKKVTRTDKVAAFFSYLWKMRKKNDDYATYKALVQNFIIILKSMWRYFIYISKTATFSCVTYFQPKTNHIMFQYRNFSFSLKRNLFSSSNIIMYPSISILKKI